MKTGINKETKPKEPTQKEKEKDINIISNDMLYKKDCIIYKCLEQNEEGEWQKKYQCCNPEYFIYAYINFNGDHVDKKMFSMNGERYDVIKTKETTH